MSAVAGRVERLLDRLVAPIALPGGVAALQAVDLVEPTDDGEADAEVVAVIGPLRWEGEQLAAQVRLNGVHAQRPAMAKAIAEEQRLAQHGKDVAGQGVTHGGTLLLP